MVKKCKIDSRTPVTPLASFKIQYADPTNSDFKCAILPDKLSAEALCLTWDALSGQLISSLAE